jgi:hypothetical protein
MAPVVMPRGMRALFSTLETSAKLSTGLSHRSKHAPWAIGAAVGILNLVGRGTLTPAGTAVEAAAGFRETAFCIRARTFASLPRTSTRRDDYSAHAARAADRPVVALAVLACVTDEGVSTSLWIATGLLPRKNSRASAAARSYLPRKSWQQLQRLDVAL